jgi:CheY-like chemotaxis protein
LGKEQSEIIIEKDIFNEYKGLVLVDSPEAKENIAEHLLHVSLNFDCYFEVEKILDILSKNPNEYNVLVVDWQFHKDPSFMVKVREFAPNIVLPAILLAPLSSKATGESVAEYFNDVVLKPFSHTSLLKALYKAFGKEEIFTKTKTSKIMSGEKLESIKGARILLTEDNEVNQLVACKIMEKAGLEVTIANNGLVALSILEKESFDLVLMDIQMPEMDGFEATKILRANPKFDHLPIVAMTAHAMSGDRELSLESGMNDHVTKPINITELFMTLLKWIPAKDETNVTEAKKVTT